jgi:O-antigen/teichoic acid export membrane protein
MFEKKTMFFIKRTTVLKNSFFKNVLILMSGTIIAQIITVAVSPILTRLFSPSLFGVYGVYMSIVAIVTAVVTMRYDQALMLPKNNKDAAHLFWASLIVVTVVSLVSLIICVLFFRQIPTLLKVTEFGWLVLLLPLSIFLAGVYQTLNSWSTRQKQFKRASISQVVRSSVAVGVQIPSGAVKASPAGLIGGAVMGDFFASLVLAFQVNREDHKILGEGLHWHSIKHLGKQYSDFPLYSSTQNLFNAISQNIPLILLAKFFGPAVVGFYALGVRVLQLPMNLVLTSLRQVLFQKASEVYNSGGDTYALFKKTTLGLVAIAAVPAITVILFGPALFGFVLGKEWIVAGEYAKWLVLWLICMFVNLPAVLFGQIYRKQRALLIQDIFLLFFRVMAIFIGGIRKDPLLAIILYSFVGAFFNLLIIGWAGYFIKKPKNL